MLRQHLNRWLKNSKTHSEEVPPFQIPFNDLNLSTCGWLASGPL